MGENMGRRPHQIISSKHERPNFGPRYKERPNQSPCGLFYHQQKQPYFLCIQILDPDTKRDQIKVLVDYFTINKNNHTFYAFKFFLCEVLNLVNVVGQIYFMDFFLGGEFTRYGTDVLAMTELPPEERDDPMARVFPKMTKCTFHKFGPSGTVEKFDGLCVLPL